MSWTDVCRWTWKLVGRMGGFTPWPACGRTPVKPWQSPEWATIWPRRWPGWMSWPTARTLSGAQPDRFRPAPPAVGQSPPAVAGSARGGHAQTESAGLPPQSVSPSRQALPGRIVDTGPPERSRAGRQAYAGGVRQPAEGFPQCAVGIAHGLALAYHGRRRRGVRPVFRVPAGLASAVRRRGPGCHSSVSGRQRLPGRSQGGRDGCGTAGLGTCLRAGVVVGGRRQLGDAALGASSISWSRPAGSPAAG